jgi:hypothetical protein
MKPPIEIRLSLALTSVFFCIFLSFLGWKNIYHDRSLRGAILIGCGALIAAVGIGLFLLTRFPGTWDWYL